MHMRSPVNKSYILDILRLKPSATRTMMVLGVAVGFFYKSWVIFSQRKSFKKIIFFRTFWAHRSLKNSDSTFIPLTLGLGFCLKNSQNVEYVAFIDRAPHMHTQGTEPKTIYLSLAAEGGEKIHLSGPLDIQWDVQ